jgi:hypothetical protein
MRGWHGAWRTPHRAQTVENGAKERMQGSRVDGKRRRQVRDSHKPSTTRQQFASNPARGLSEATVMTG